MILAFEEIPNERALGICRMMGKYGLVATTLFTRKDVAYILNDTLKKFDNNSFEIFAKIDELKELLNEISEDTDKDKVLSQTDELKKSLKKIKYIENLLNTALN